MIVELSPEQWAQVRHKYEHTDKPVADICADYRISPGTLHDRRRRWRWTRRRPPIPAEGPPPTQPIEQMVPLVPAMTPIGSAPPEPDAAAGDSAAPSPAPQSAPGDETPPDPAGIAARLRGAVARVLPAIEATLGKLPAGPMPPREMERAARTLTSLTRTLRELHELLSQYPPAKDEGPANLEEFRAALARKIDGIIARRPGGTPPDGYVPYGG